MSSLSNIRNQLRASENIKQIATSMEMVASARFRKAQTKAKQAKVYIERMRAILEHLSTASTDTRHPLLMQKKIKGSCEKCGAVIAPQIKGSADHLMQIFSPRRTNFYQNCFLKTWSS